MVTWQGALYHKEKPVLPEMRISNSLFRISYGLMFSSRKKIRKGLCMVFPATKDVRYGASVTMFFVWYPLDIIFVNSSGIVVDKITLKPWLPSYTPRAACRYVIEAQKGQFSDLAIGDKVHISGLKYFDSLFFRFPTADDTDSPFGLFMEEFLEFLVTFSFLGF